MMCETASIPVHYSPLAITLLAIPTDARACCRVRRVTLPLTPRMR